MIGKNLAVTTIAVIFISLLGLNTYATDQHPYHKYIMRGSIIETDGANIYLCIGTRDGAKAGQELDVYHIKIEKNLHSKLPPKYHRKKVGTVRIKEVVDEHFANATIISGSAGLNDIVELEIPEN